MSKVSVIVPAYNAEKTIGRCVESVLNQTYQDIELIVMDDGSRDSTAAILDEYAAKDARLRVVHKVNSGVSDTRNQALDLATGDYIQFLDADDWSAPDATRLFVRAMEDNECCDMVIADFYRVIDDKMAQKGNIEEERLYTREEYGDLMMKAPADFYYGVLWNKFFRRRIIEENELRMDVNLSWSEDFIFNMEYVLHTDMIYALKAPVYYYVKTEGSLASLSGSSFADTLKMKLQVLEYYRSFYKDICKPGQYYLRSPQIYGFMLNFARDGGVNSFAPEKKLGHDRADVRIAPGMEKNLFASNYQEDRMLESALRRFMKGNNLEEGEAQVVLYLKLAGGIATVPEIRNYTGLTGRSLAGTIQKLIRKKIIERVKADEPERERRRGASSEKSADKGRKTDKSEIPFRPVKALALADAVQAGDSERAAHMYKEVTAPSPEEEIPVSEVEQAEILADVNDKERIPGIIAFVKDSKNARLVQDALERIFRDVEEIELQGFSDEEKEIYGQLRLRATANVYRSLSEHVAKSTAAEGAAVIEKVTAKKAES